MDLAIRDAVATYVTTVLACALIAQRRREARQRGENVGDVAPQDVRWPIHYQEWISGQSSGHELLTVDLAVAIAAVTAVPPAIVTAILSRVYRLPCDAIRTAQTVQDCQIAALHVLVGPLGGVAL